MVRRTSESVARFIEAILALPPTPEVETFPMPVPGLKEPKGEAAKKADVPPPVVVSPPPPMPGCEESDVIRSS